MRFFPLALAAACLLLHLPPANAEDSLLRVRCEGADIDSIVIINGQTKGECPFDAQLAPGSYHIRAFKKVDETTERAFEKQLEIGAGTVKRLDIVLSAPQRNFALRTQALESHKRLVALAEAGDIAAMNQLALMHINGEGVPRNAKIGVMWLEKLAARNDSNAIYMLGTAYERGTGMAQDSDRAFALYQRAADLGHAEGLGYLAAMYNDGTGTARDLDMAITLATEAAGKGSKRAQVVLAAYDLDLYRRRAGVGNAARGRATLEGLANGGFWHSMYSLSVILGDASDAQLYNLDKAIFWAEKAVAASNDARALLQLAMLNVNKQTPASIQQARKYFQLAADAGSIRALGVLGHYVREGIGGSKDPVKGFEMSQRAAKSGDTYAQAGLGSIYEYGDGVAKDRTQAIYWFQQCASSEHCARKVKELSQ